MNRARFAVAAALDQCARAERLLEDTEAVLFQAEAAAVAALVHRAAGNTAEAEGAHARAEAISTAKGTVATPPWIASLPSVRMPR